jgi:pyruvate kinase
MHTTEVAPTVPIQLFKRTKIITTLGPATNTAEAIYSLIEAGANGIRLNFSHGTHEERLVQIPWIRAASEKLGKPVAIIQDLQGPKIRLGDFEGTIEIKTDEALTFKYKADYAATGHIPTQYDLSQKVKPGERLYLFDGKVRTTVIEVRDGVVYATANNAGVIMKRKGMNLPDTDFNGDVLTDKDMDDIRFGVTQDIDYVATSFVQTATDIENLRKILVSLGSQAKIIAKIETKAAVDNIEEITRVSDAIMVARGDLAVETPAEAVPVVQRQIIGLGRKYAKPTIVATQMLLSMVEMPEPTRAEVSDVATAVFTGADCVMLSDETANGKYPIETVQTMKRVLLYAEQHPSAESIHPYGFEQGLHYAISSGVLTLAEKIDAKVILAETMSGATALRIAALRPTVPVMAVTSEVRTAQQLALVYGTKSYIRPAHADAVITFTDWLQECNVFKPGDAVVTVSGRQPGVAGTTDTIRVRMLK